MKISKGTFINGKGLKEKYVIRWKGKGWRTRAELDAEFDDLIDDRWTEIGANLDKAERRKDERNHRLRTQLAQQSDEPIISEVSAEIQGTADGSEKDKV